MPGRIQAGTLRGKLAACRAREGRSVQRKTKQTEKLTATLESFVKEPESDSRGV
jgi:hypothetical protein